MAEAAKSGSKIVWYVLGGFGVLILVIAGAAFLFLKSETGTKMTKLLGMQKELIEKGMSAPGAAEVRALGCNQGYVLDMRAVFELVKTEDSPEPPPPPISVVCSVRHGMAPPTCEAVEAAYLGAVPDQKLPFSSLVRREEDNKVLCQTTREP